MIPNQLQIGRLAQQYQTNRDLITNLSSVLNLDEVERILIMKPGNLSKTVRVNLLKTTRKTAISRLLKEGIRSKSLDFVEEGLVIQSGWNKIGNSQTYLRGEIMPQGLGSMLAVQALNPQPGEMVLDMAAAPGGKSCFIGERLAGEGIIISNDYSKKRSAALISNLSRHGITHSVVTMQDGMTIQTPPLDRVLLDAPCTGEGLLVSQPMRRKSKTIINNYQLQKVQISLLKRAISLLKPGGRCVYSTCSITTPENEEVIAEVLDKVEIVEQEIPGIPGQDTIHPDLERARRLLPSIHGCDGFFIVTLEKR
jgi:ribosomal RNA methyltransferase Nop2